MSVLLQCFFFWFMRPLTAMQRRLLVRPLCKSYYFNFFQLEFPLLRCFHLRSVSLFAREKNEHRRGGRRRATRKLSLFAVGLHVWNEVYLNKPVALGARQRGKMTCLYWRKLTLIARFPSKERNRTGSWKRQKVSNLCSHLQSLLFLFFCPPPRHLL